jgi:hypothetical protein
MTQWRTARPRRTASRRASWRMSAQFVDGLADGFGIESCVDRSVSDRPFTRKAVFRRGRADGVGADVLEESDGTESVLSVVAFVDGAVEREIADHREAELILGRLFHAEQQMFAASKALSLRWAAVSKQLESIQSSIAELLRKRRSHFETHARAAHCNAVGNADRRQLARHVAHHAASQVDCRRCSTHRLVASDSCDGRPSAGRHAAGVAAD